MKDFSCSRRTDNLFMARWLLEIWSSISSSYGQKTASCVMKSSHPTHYFNLWASWQTWKECCRNTFSQWRSTAETPVCTYVPAAPWSPSDTRRTPLHSGWQTGWETAGRSSPGRNLETWRTQWSVHVQTIFICSPMEKHLPVLGLYVTCVFYMHHDEVFKLPVVHLQFLKTYCH